MTFPDRPRTPAPGLETSGSWDQAPRWRPEADPAEVCCEYHAVGSLPPDQMTAPPTVVPAACPCGCDLLPSEPAHGWTALERQLTAKCTYLEVDRLRVLSEADQLRSERQGWVDLFTQNMATISAGVAEKDAEIERLTAERDEFRQMARFSQKDEEAMAIIHRAADLLRDDDNLTRAVVEADHEREVQRLTAELDAAHHEHQAMHSFCSATPAVCSHEAQPEPHTGNPIKGSVWADQPGS